MQSAFDLKMLAASECYHDEITVFDNKLFADGEPSQGASPLHW